MVDDPSGRRCEELLSSRIARSDDIRSEEHLSRAILNIYKERRIDALEHAKILDDSGQIVLVAGNVCLGELDAGETGEMEYLLPCEFYLRFGHICI